MIDDTKVHSALTAIHDACDELTAAEDDAVRVYALRVAAMTRALVDSVLAPAPVDRPTPHG
jgi:hypothetical protein